MRNIYGAIGSVVTPWLIILQPVSAGQAQRQPTPSSIHKICTISFDKDARRPARPEDDAKECITHAAQTLKLNPDSALYLVATADREKDNHASNGSSRIEQDMSGDDLRYADVAAYRAINTKAYMVRWLRVSPKSVVPFTTYEDGQWLEFYSVRKGTDFKSLYDKKTAPIIERPCTTGPCAARFEEFLVAQQRTRIPD